jgi:hypothetical protein
LRGGCFGKAAASCPFCVDSGQLGADAHVRRRNWESRRQAPPNATSTAGAWRSPRRRDGSARRSLPQSGAHPLPVPPTAIHEHTQQTHFQVSTLDNRAVCHGTRLCALLSLSLSPSCLLLYIKEYSIALCISCYVTKAP